MISHEGCAECCGVGRCHWCLRAGSVLLWVDGKGTFRACVKHANLTQDSNKFPKAAIVGHEGLRPRELTIDEEAIRRASVAIHNYSQDTPATLR